MLGGNGLRISFTRKADILIAKLEGELDHHHADDLRLALDRQLEDGSIKNLIYDLGV